MEDVVKTVVVVHAVVVTERVPGPYPVHVHHCGPRRVLADLDFHQPGESFALREVFVQQPVDPASAASSALLSASSGPVFPGRAHSASLARVRLRWLSVFSRGGGVVLSPGVSQGSFSSVPPAEAVIRLATWPSTPLSQTLCGVSLARRAVSPVRSAKACAGGFLLVCSRDSGKGVREVCLMEGSSMAEAMSATLEERPGPDDGGDSPGEESQEGAQGGGEEGGGEEGGGENGGGEEGGEAGAGE